MISLEQAASVLRCCGCQGALSAEDQALRCTICSEKYPIRDGIPRLVPRNVRDLLESASNGTAEDTSIATALSFAFEWSRFPEMYACWEQNFLSYVAPHTPDYFAGKRVLDAGCGTGRHAFYASRFGADVWAIDLGPHIEVARRNTADCRSVQMIQADLLSPPFAPESFDHVYSLGVLHHIGDPNAALRSLVRLLKPGGELQVFVYWKPEGQPLKALGLGAVALARRLTVRLPFWSVYWLSYAAAIAAFAFFVIPHLVLRRIPGLRRVAARLPMRQYALYPFRVCVQDQFDRFSAPIEKRFTREEVETWLRAAGLDDVTVRPNFGWAGSGRKRAETAG